MSLLAQLLNPPPPHVPPRYAVRRHRLEDVDEASIDFLPRGFPDRLRELRERKGLTQTALAKRSGVGHSRISMFELERRRASDAALIALAQALDVTPEYLRGADDAAGSDGD